MKKFIALIGLLVAVSVQGATHQSFSFLNPQVYSIYLTNHGTAAASGVTNLSVPENFTTTYASSYQTNWAFTTWTNIGGGYFRTTNNIPTNATGVVNERMTNFNLLGSVPLWTTPGGPPYGMNSTNIWGNAAGPLGDASLHIRARFLDADHDAGILFRFAPSPDGSPLHVCTNAASVWGVTIQPGSGTIVGHTLNFVTNAPMHLWPGCKSLYLLSITNPEDEADCDVIVFDCSLNGFVP